MRDTEGPSDYVPYITLSHISAILSGTCHNVLIMADITMPMSSYAADSVASQSDNVIIMLPTV